MILHSHWDAHRVAILESNQGIHPLDCRRRTILSRQRRNEFSVKARKIPTVGDTHGKHLHLSPLPYCLSTKNGESGLANPSKNASGNTWAALHDIVPAKI